jgi:hypothetical protein
MKWIKFLPLTFLFILACGNSNKKGNSADTAQKTSSAMATDNAAAAAVIATSPEGFIRETERKPALLFGKTIQCQPGETILAFQKELPLLTKALANGGGVIAGPLMMVYDKAPGQTGVTEFFCGIPVAKSWTAEKAYAFRKLSGGTFMEMEGGAEAGNTGKNHESMRKLLQEQHITVGLPALEILSESRNSEMTVVSKVKILYPKVP